MKWVCRIQCREMFVASHLVGRGRVGAGGEQRVLDVRRLRDGARVVQRRAAALRETQHVVHSCACVSAADSARVLQGRINEGPHSHKSLPNFVMSDTEDARKIEVHEAQGGGTQTSFPVS